MSRIVALTKPAMIFALSGLVGPSIAGIERAVHGNATPNFFVYNVVNLLWPVRMLGVYDYSVATLVLLSLLLALLVGVMATLLSAYVRPAVGYSAIAAWTILVWAYFSGFDVQSGHKLPVIISLFVQLGAWAVATRLGRAGR